MSNIIAAIAGLFGRSQTGKAVDASNAKWVVDAGLFDSDWYRDCNADVKHAGIVPYRHFLRFGANEGRAPYPGFDLVRYRDQYCPSSLTLVDAWTDYVNREDRRFSVFHSLAGNSDSVPPKTPAGVTSYEFLEPGPGYEEQKYDLSKISLAEKVIAYYLPQYYPFEENNRWWGTGFTEWRNVARGRPRFRGHYQPHLPRDLGYYDLRNKDVIAQQIEMAQKAGLFGFCFYYYWFERQRLLDQPVELFLSSPELQMPFCLMWANENWTRTWDGCETDVLMEQRYEPDADEALVADWARHFADPRYIRIDGKPLFFVYRANIIPKAKKRIKHWRKLLKKNHDIEVHFFLAQSFNQRDPADYGLDGAVEFPPHKLSEGLPRLNEQLDINDPSFTGNCYAYDGLIANGLHQEELDYDLIKCVVPTWDNEARRPNNGSTFVGSTPEKFKTWMQGALDYSRRRPVLGNQSFVFVNAWNEWAEGAHLEPDIYHGSAYLNRVSEALLDDNSDRSHLKIVYVGHDAHKHGAQMLSLNIVRQLQTFGVKVEIILLNGGELLEQYQQLTTTHVVNSSREQFETTLDAIKSPTYVVTNTTVSGDYVDIVKRKGLRVLSLIHELPGLIAEYKLENAVNNLANHADHLVFAADAVKQGFESLAGQISGKTHLLPQGIYQNLDARSSVVDLRADLRSKLDLPADSRIVVGVGYADLRKGFDLFVAAAKQMLAQDSRVHFLWIGNIEESLKHWFRREYETLENFTSVDFTNDIASYLYGADLYALTSREDPFPSVMLEALACGIPVVGFKESGGCCDLLKNTLYGSLANYGDVDDLSHQILAQLDADHSESRIERSVCAKDQFSWRNYVFSLLETLDPSLKRVSAVIPNYNYQNYIADRIHSVFSQTYPIYQILLLDDQSTDQSLERIETYVGASGREIDFEINDSNSGSPFAQWRKGVDQAQGEFVWIAEADDLCDAGFLQAVLSRPSEFDMAVTDSKQIDENGTLLADSYNYYYSEPMKAALGNQNLQEGKEFYRQCMSVKNQILNVSAVVFKTASLDAAMDRVYDELLGYKVAGDWRLYFEILRQKDAKIRLIDSGLNIHRRHQNSQTHSHYNQAQFNEISGMQQLAIDLELTANIQQQQADYLQEIGELFGITND